VGQIVEFQSNYDMPKSACKLDIVAWSYKGCNRELLKSTHFVNTWTIRQNRKAERPWG
jgi:hypothetical protein